MEHRLPPENDIYGLFAALRSSGFRLTKARQAVIESLAESAGHLTAPEFVDVVRRRAPGGGRAAECHKTVEFDDCVLDELEWRLGERLGFEFDGRLVEIYGRCPDFLARPFDIQPVFPPSRRSP